MVPKKKLEKCQQQIRLACSLCTGSGCSECESQCSRIAHYAIADIPVTYWGLSWKDYRGDEQFKKLIADKLSNVEKFFDDGQSLLFTGQHGTGKTYATCAFLKMAVAHRFSAKYTAMQDIVNQILSKQLDSHQVLKELIEVDFLAIDEFDPRWIFPSENVEQIFGKALEHILRTRFQNGLPTILSSNVSDVDSILTGKFGKAFKSLRSQFIQVVPVAGIDYRRSGQDG